MRRIVKILGVAVLLATVLVISFTAAFARPLRGGLPLQEPELSQSFVCERLLGNHSLFRPDDPNEAPAATCWLRTPDTRPDIDQGLVRASKVVPPT